MSTCLSSPGALKYLLSGGNQLDFFGLLMVGSTLYSDNSEVLDCVKTLGDYSDDKLLIDQLFLVECNSNSSSFFDFLGI